MRWPIDSGHGVRDKARTLNLASSTRFLHR